MPDEQIVRALVTLLRRALRNEDVVPGPAEMQPLMLTDNFVTCWAIASGEEIDAALATLRAEKEPPHAG